MIGWILLVLVLSGWVASAIEPPAARPPERAVLATLDWVHTVDGWEQSSRWPMRQLVYQPPLHPALVALGQALASVMALVAFASSPNQNSPTRD